MVPQQVQFASFGEPDVLELVEVASAQPGPGEVLLNVHAIGLNRADAMMRRDQYIETPELPSKLGYDAAGVVAAVGEGVSDVAVGDRVLTIPAYSQSEHGV